MYVYAEGYDYYYEYNIYVSGDTQKDIYLTPHVTSKIYVYASVYDYNNDGQYNYVWIWVYDQGGYPVEGAEVWIDGVFYDYTDTYGELYAYNFDYGLHTVDVYYDTLSASTEFYITKEGYGVAHIKIYNFADKAQTVDIYILIMYMMAPFMHIQGGMITAM